MKYSDLKPPKRIGFDGDTFRAVDSKGVVYDCYCSECNEKIVAWETDFNNDTNNVGCVSWHITNDEDVVIVARVSQDQNKLF